MSETAIHPRLQFWLQTSELLAIAAETGARRARKALVGRARKSGVARKPGPETPLWNVFSSELKLALQSRGAKSRLARYLGIPKQRVHEFVSRRRRIPDAEITLRMLHWLAEDRTGRDRSL
jgi:hypothetical protein